MPHKRAVTVADVRKLLPALEGVKAGTSYGIHLSTKRAPKRKRPRNRWRGATGR